jgi:dTDP-4-amino-4,6-dideoxygalactose transaminase
VREALASGSIAGDGAFCRKSEALLGEILGKRVLLTTSCTHALEMSALLLDIEPGDEVIVPAFTFVSTANAFAMHRGKPVFGDIRPDTLNLDEAKLPGLVSERTKAIVVVHYGGIGCEMDAILEIASARGIRVIEDNAHGLFGAYHGRPLGTFGALATQSFHETKNISCGEGGALVIGDRSLIDRAEILREKGTDRSRFFRGQVDKYTWVDHGSSWVLSDVLGALLLAQLEAREAIQARRASIWRRYERELRSWAAAHGVTMPVVPADRTSSHHLFHLLLPTLDARTAFLAHLRQRGIGAVFHYVPLHLSPMGRRFGGTEGDCPVTESVSDRLVRLPFHFDLTEDEQSRVIEAVLTYA